MREDDGRLHDWMFDRATAADAEVLDEVYAPTGAIIMGKRIFDLGGPWGDPPPFHTGICGDPRGARRGRQTAGAFRAAGDGRVELERICLAQSSEFTDLRFRVRDYEPGK
jgi:hypothetical protein